MKNVLFITFDSHTHTHVNIYSHLNEMFIIFVLIIHARTEKFNPLIKTHTERDFTDETAYYVFFLLELLFVDDGEGKKVAP